MLIRQLVTELYGDKATSQVRPDYRWMLNVEHDSLLPNDLMGLAYGLHLHGTPGMILWAWECHIRNKAVTEQASHGTQGVGWGRV